ncbi:MAG: acetyltransferase [Pirellulaceae bacterium]
MATHIIIIGAGQFGREIHQYIEDVKQTRDVDWQIKGFLDSNLKALDGYNIGPDILGTVEEHSVDPTARYVCAMGDARLRNKIFDHFKNQDAALLTLIHPTAYVAPSASIGEGAILAPFSFVSVNAVIGKNVALNTYASCGHDAVVGQSAVLSPYAVINGCVRLENEVFMGTHSTVIPRKTVGAHSKIAAGAVVMKDIPKMSIAYGNPAVVGPLLPPRTQD